MPFSNDSVVEGIRPVEARVIAPSPSDIPQVGPNVTVNPFVPRRPLPVDSHIAVVGVGHNAMLRNFALSRGVHAREAAHVNPQRYVQPIPAEINIPLHAFLILRLERHVPKHLRPVVQRPGFSMITHRPPHGLPKVLLVLAVPSANWPQRANVHRGAKACSL